MNTQWLKRNGADHLILAFGGWALGPAPFLALSGDQDLLFYDDYRQLDAPAPGHLSYKTVSVLAYSFGVASCLHWLEQTGFAPDHIVAVNGTAFPTDPARGIAPDQVAATADTLSEENFTRFCRRAGLKHPPQIDIHSRRDELCAIAKRGNAPPRHINRIWVSSKDRIVPPAAQHRAWADQAQRVIEIDAPHMPFQPGQDWQEWMS